MAETWAEKQDRLAAELNVVAGNGQAAPRDHDEPSSWVPLDLRPVLAGRHVAPTPTVFARDDGRCLFYAGAVNGIHGDSGIGKSLLWAAVAADELNAGHPVLVIDFEDTESTLVDRLRHLGVHDETIASGLIYVRPTEPATPEGIGHLIDMAVGCGVRLAVVDSVGEALAVEGLNEDRDNEVGPWVRSLSRRLADAGLCVLLVDHSTKASDNPLHPSGSKRKRAAISGASYLVECVTPLVRPEPDAHEDTTGRLRLICAKDRHGTYARGKVVADFVLTSSPKGGLWAKLWPPKESTAAPAAELPIVLAANAAVAALKALTIDENAVSQKRLLVGMKGHHKAGTEVYRGGIDHAVATGRIVESSGPHSARMFALPEPPDGPPDVADQPLPGVS